MSHSCWDDRASASICPKFLYIINCQRFDAVVACCHLNINDAAAGQIVVIGNDRRDEFEIFIQNFSKHVRVLGHILFGPFDLRPQNSSEFGRVRPTLQ